jgi:hypothetical protein
VECQAGNAPLTFSCKTCGSSLRSFSGGSQRPLQFLLPPAAVFCCLESNEMRTAVANRVLKLSSNFSLVEIRIFQVGAPPQNGSVPEAAAEPPITAAFAFLATLSSILDHGLRPSRSVQLTSGDDRVMTRLRKPVQSAASERNYSIISVF